MRAAEEAGSRNYYEIQQRLVDYQLWRLVQRGSRVAVGSRHIQKTICLKFRTRAFRRSDHSNYRIQEGVHLVPCYNDDNLSSCYNWQWDLGILSLFNECATVHQSTLLQSQHSRQTLEVYRFRLFGEAYPYPWE